MQVGCECTMWGSDNEMLVRLLFCLLRVEMDAKGGQGI
jgi:hypothetical protein